MKKFLTLILLSALFISCGSDDDDNPFVGVWVSGNDVWPYNEIVFVYSKNDLTIYNYDDYPQKPSNTYKYTFTDNTITIDGEYWGTYKYTIRDNGQILLERKDHSFVLWKK